MSNQLTTDQKIQHYVTLREHKKQADKEFKKSMERVNAAMEKLENELLEDLEAEGVSSKTAKGIGTAYVRVVTNMTTEDRDEFLKYCLKNRELDAMDVRPNRTIIKEKSEKGEVIPGVKITQTRLLGIRKG